MYVIFPADEVVSLTYGRVIIPRTSSSRTPSTRVHSERSSLDSRRCSSNQSYRVQDIAETFDCDNNFLLNGDSASPKLGRSKAVKEKSDSVLQRDKSTNRPFFNITVKRERSPISVKPPTLGPDPRLQLTNLQDPPGDSAVLFYLCS